MGIGNFKLPALGRPGFGSRKKRFSRSGRWRMSLAPLSGGLEPLRAWGGEGQAAHDFHVAIVAPPTVKMADPRKRPSRSIEKNPGPGPDIDANKSPRKPCRVKAAGAKPTRQRCRPGDATICSANPRSKYRFPCATSAVLECDRPGYAEGGSRASGPPPVPSQTRARCTIL